MRFSWISFMFRKLYKEIITPWRTSSRAVQPRQLSFRVTRPAFTLLSLLLKNFSFRHLSVHSLSSSRLRSEPTVWLDPCSNCVKAPGFPGSHPVLPVKRTQAVECDFMDREGGLTQRRQWARLRAPFQCRKEDKDRERAWLLFRCGIPCYKAKAYKSMTKGFP